MSGTAPRTAAEYWDKYRPQRRSRPAADRFDWTGIPGNGPGAEILGTVNTALDLGPAEGENAAFLAHSGVQVTAVDFSSTQVERAQRFWRGTPNLTFVHDEACNFLDQNDESFDLIYSTWGAVWFTDPDELLPRIAKRLSPGSLFAFSHRESTTSEYGAQQMGGKWLEGRETELTVLRWQYTLHQWADLLKHHGFTDVEAEIVPAPEASRLGTLIVRARIYN